MKKALIILGSGRSDGNTQKLMNYIKAQLDIDHIDLLQKDIKNFRYDEESLGDDFLPTIKNFVDHYDLMILATPVYWYSMSGVMKNFFDRFMILLTNEKETGRKLKGKAMAVVSCANDKILIDGFYNPFKASADYLGMDYIADVHNWSENGLLDEENKIEMNAFIEKVNIFLNTTP